MQKVSSFEQVRVDGNVITGAMTVGEMLALGWAPAKVIALRWLHDEKTIEFRAPSGAHGIVVPGGNFVAAILHERSSDVRTQLSVFNADGARRGTLENSLRLAGIDADGSYRWFEPAVTSGADRFGAVFQAGTSGEFRCDIDARDLRVLALARIR